MPVQPTYPGVYIEEIPSGVRTITGVATSITAFIGYTSRGAVNEAGHIFSFADFERGFGGLAFDSPLSHAVKHFFQNGGSEAYVVRVAAGALAASVVVKNQTAGGKDVLEVSAASEGSWGNKLLIAVDYATADPASLFNLTATELTEKNGDVVPGRTELFRNLSMNSRHPNFVTNVVNAGSSLITVALPAGFKIEGQGSSTSGVLELSDVDLAAGYRLAYTLNGQGPYEVSIATQPTGDTLAKKLDAIAKDVKDTIEIASPPGVTGSSSSGRLTFKAVTDSTHPAEQSAIHFLEASTNSVTKRLKLGTEHGGTEPDAAGLFRPAPTGTVGTVAEDLSAALVDGALEIEIFHAGTSAPPKIPVPIWGQGTDAAKPDSFARLTTLLNDALVKAARNEPRLDGAGAILYPGALRLVPGGHDPNISYKVSGTAAALLGLGASGAENLAAYAPGAGAPVRAQGDGVVGTNGTPPGPAELTGSEREKKGLYALENVDIFNLLAIPDATTDAGMMSVLGEAKSYCERRRAFLIVDVPGRYDTFEKAEAWIAGAEAASLRSRNSGLFFPRLRMPDPFNPRVTSTFPAAGALAGLFARTDAERGVWKAPAGTSAMMTGATGLSYKLTDLENGKLNQQGLNCLRTFPVYGPVNWGARTGKGSDAMADEYKYIPVRRLALFLEESLYRGTQWVVFEPNDEPLWAQIRLNLGAFMHTLFAQGAFRGRTPREAYFVKCDMETTTQNDVDLGRVNIAVGFAPLKPAEFVILQIQQIAGAIQT